MKAATETRKETTPIRLRPAMTFTCTLSYYGPSKRVKLTWEPDRPTDAAYCVPGDTIKFKSPDVMSKLVFADSPFERTEGPQTYTVDPGETLTKKVNKRILGEPLQKFKFKCKPDGYTVLGSGGTVPVHGGGNAPN
jgi:hypothetical protein